MKKLKYLFLIFVASALVSCGNPSEPPLVGDWDRRAVFPLAGRSHAATFVIGDKGYVVSGTHGLNRQLRRDVVAFDHTAGSLDRRGMTQGSWSRLENIPDSMPARQQAVGFSLNVGGKVYGFVGTGWTWSEEVRDMVTLNDFWRFDPDTEDWEEITPMPPNASKRRAAIAFTLSIEGLEYGFVGFGFEGDPERNYLLDLWRYDPRQEGGQPWTEVGGYSGDKRRGATVFVIDNRAYISTGDNGNTLVSEHFVFDPDGVRHGRPMWSRLRDTRNASRDHDFDNDWGPLPRTFGVAYVASVDGQLRGHIVGGATAAGAVPSIRPNSNWEYDHEHDLWQERTTFVNNGAPRNRAGMVTFSFPHTGRAFVGMGVTGTTHLDDFWEFIPLVDDCVEFD